MDYIVRDSSVLPDRSSISAVINKDDSIRIGIVRGEQEVDDGLRYIVEVLHSGKQIPVLCKLMTRWGGPHNYEEYKVRPWLSSGSSGSLQSPASAGKYEARAGDVVIVAYLDGKGREGVILGGLGHPSRKSKIGVGEIGYISEFNGLNTQIRQDGSYKVTFNGLPANSSLLKVPPTGAPIPAPLYNPLKSGSYFGFDASGSYIASDGSQFLKIYRNLTSGSIILKSNQSTLELGGNPALGNLNIKTSNLVSDTLSSSFKSTTAFNVETLQLSLKGTRVAIGNDQFELIDGLVQLIDALGTLIVTSPVGQCTPLASAPTWVSSVLPLKIKLSLLKGSLQSAKSFSLSGDESSDLGEDIGG